MCEVKLLKGIQGSGKTTYAKQLVEVSNGKWVRVNRDDLRHMINNYKYTKENEQFITKVRDYIILESINEGKNVVVDEMNLNEKNLKHFETLIGDKANITIDDSFLSVTLEECIKRDKERDFTIGEDIIKKTYDKYKGLYE
jgi:predicted kinase